MEKWEEYAESMQDNNVTDDGLYISDMDIYLSVAKWQLGQDLNILFDKIYPLTFSDPNPRMKEVVKIVAMDLLKEVIGNLQTNVE